MVRKLLLLVVAVITIIAMVVPGCTPPTLYNLTMAEDPAGGGTATDLTGPSPYAANTRVDIEAVAATGYVFLNWSADAGTFDDANAATTVFVMPAEDVKVTANFGRVYDLNMAVSPLGAGTTTPAGTTSQGAGASVTIQAAAATGYVFLNWSADAGTFGDANAATTTFTMPDEDVTVTANFVPLFDLIMDVSPSGGGTTTPSGTTSHAAGTDINIQATATTPYSFSHWSATAGVLTDPNAATTTFEMPAEDAIVTAHFVGPLDHATIYEVDWATAPLPIGEDVTLVDQFGLIEATVVDTIGFANPAQKFHEPTGELPVYNPDHHVTIYTIEYAGEPQSWTVQVENQFGVQSLTVTGPYALAVPTQKIQPHDHGEPVGLDHYLFYWVTESPYIGETVGVLDEFGDPVETTVYRAVGFANPVEKRHDGVVTETLNPEDHFVIYETDPGPFEVQVTVSNQFIVDEHTFDIFGPAALAVPSKKHSYYTPALDHFKCYWVEAWAPIFEPAYLEDQFGAFDAMVEFAWWFANPVAKSHGYWESWIWNWDHHLTIYGISHPGPTEHWAVEVDNQFGTQFMTVSGPVALAVPTQKEGHFPPEGLDHYLIYEVMDYELPINAEVGLDDQWTYEDVLVTVPRYFANPVKKTHGGGAAYDIVNPDAHLVFYEILGGPFFYPGLTVYNQFLMYEPQILDVFDAGFLATPSWKLYAESMG